MYAQNSVFIFIQKLLTFCNMLLGLEIIFNFCDAYYNAKLILNS